MRSKKILISLGGGPTPVTNQSIAGVVLEARRFASVERIYGSLQGARGIVDEDFADLTGETRQNLENIAATPASVLGATRDTPDEAYCLEMLRVLEAHDIGGFFYIGGHESTGTVATIAREARRRGLDLACVHIPKTIDNDIAGCDHTPGFPSAARFVAEAFIGINLESRSLPGVHVAVVMGRHAGFLTAAATLGKKYEDDGPHLVYVPERPFTVEGFLADVAATLARRGRCVVAVSEGIRDAEGRRIHDLLAARHAGRLAPGLSGRLSDLLCLEVAGTIDVPVIRSDTLGYLQRSFLGCVSDVDQHEARQAGEKAVHYALREGRDGSVAIIRTGNYSVDYRLLPLDEVGGRTRTMDDAFLDPDRPDVTDAYRYYLRPLVGSGMPDVYRLRPNRVPPRPTGSR